MRMHLICEWKILKVKKRKMSGLIAKIQAILSKESHNRVRAANKARAEAAGTNKTILNEENHDICAPNKKHAIVRCIGEGLAFFVGGATGIIGGVAVRLVFPHWGIWWAVLIGFGGFVCETLVYRKDVPDALETLFVKGSVLGYVEREIRRNAAKEKENYQVEYFNTLADMLDKLANAKDKDLKELGDKFKTQEAGDTLRGKAASTAEALRVKADALKDKIEGYERTPSDREILAKKCIAWVIVIVALLNGLGFFAIALTHMHMALAFLLNVSVLPSYWLAPLSFLSGIAAIAFTLLMYKVMIKFLVLDYSYLRWQLEQYCRKENRTRKWWIKNILLGVLFLIVLAITVLVTLGTGGTWLKESIACWTKLFGLVSSSATTLSSVVICGFVMPLSFTFDMTRGCWALDQGAKGIQTVFTEQGLQKIKDKWKSLTAMEKFLVICDGLFSIVFLIAHVVGDGSVPGEALKNTHSCINRIFVDLSLVTGGILSPHEIAVIVGSAQEFVVDVPYLVPEDSSDEHGHSHGLAPCQFLWSFRPGRKARREECKAGCDSVRNAVKSDEIRINTAKYQPPGEPANAANNANSWTPKAQQG